MRSSLIDIITSKDSVVASQSHRLKPGDKEASRRKRQRVKLSLDMNSQKVASKFQTAHSLCEKRKAEKENSRAKEARMNQVIVAFAHDSLPQNISSMRCKPDSIYNLYGSCLDEAVENWISFETAISRQDRCNVQNTDQDLISNQKEAPFDFKARDLSKHTRSHSHVDKVVDTTGTTHYTAGMRTKSFPKTEDLPASDRMPRGEKQSQSI